MHQEERERLARRIWRRRYGDVRGYLEGGPSFAHDEADTVLNSSPGSTSTKGGDRG